MPACQLTGPYFLTTRPPTGHTNFNRINAVRYYLVNTVVFLCLFFDISCEFRLQKVKNPENPPSAVEFPSHKCNGKSSLSYLDAIQLFGILPHTRPISTQGSSLSFFAQKLKTTPHFSN
jgi:hypothetical protein